MADVAGGGVYNSAGAGSGHSDEHDPSPGRVSGGDFIGGTYAGTNNLVGGNPLLAPAATTVDRRRLCLSCPAGRRSAAENPGQEFPPR